jgi:hypothetical protein
MENLKLIPLNNTELVSINGGDKLSEDLFYAAGYVWQKIKNFWNGYVESSKEARLADMID